MVSWILQGRKTSFRSFHAISGIQGAEMWGRDQGQRPGAETGGRDQGQRLSAIWFGVVHQRRETRIAEIRAINIRLIYDFE
jgi:hypothetical protein